MVGKEKGTRRTIQAGNTEREAKVPARRAAAAKKQGLKVVGIGASAGGLEALEQFFGNMPPDTGMAFVVVQHLDPTGHSSMPEILSRFSKMTIQVVSDGLKMEPNSIYLIPPSKNMDIRKGTLYLLEPPQPPGLRLPVDFFFRSLAREKGLEAICIILSGTGTDGTLGLRAVKAEQGTVFVQDPESAKYDGMPRSAIETGLTDFVLKPDRMPEKIMQFLRHAAGNGARLGAATKETEGPLQRIFAILKTRTGHDFSRYKESTVQRRLERRLSVNQINDIAGYARFLKGNEDEVKALLKDLLISVTSFFRDPEAFDSLKVKLKEMVSHKAQNSDLRVWVAGCATGEETYSIAMLIAECLDEQKKHLQVQVYGTDIDIDALRVARAGRYLANIAADVTQKRLKHFFSKQDSSYSIKQEIREKVVFAPQDFIKDPPFSRMDLICCRNLLIYLESDVQRRLLPLLHYALKPEGILFLGTSETTGESGDLFTVLDRKWKIYQRREVILTADRLKFPSAFAPSSRDIADGPVQTAAGAKIPQLAEKIFLDEYAPTFAVIDEKYRLVYVRGRTGKYLEIASGQPSLSILEMAREGLRTELGSALYQAASEKKKIVRERIRIKYNGGFQSISLTVSPLTGSGIPPGFLIVVFQEAGVVTEEDKTRPSVKSRKRLTDLEGELRLTRETLQATIEELEAANEEMKSANEELQSNNEELQSTNEELDTSREELQSLNEELNTVNAELQDKNDLLSKANDDLNNFVNRTDIAIVLLDEELKIRSFTPATADVFNIRHIDAGRPLNEITSRLAYDKTLDDAHEVLRSLRPKEVEVQRRDGHWFNMRISSYRTAQNVVSGLVMSLLDIDEQKKAADSLRETRDYLENLINSANAPIIVWNPDLVITRFNHAFEQLTGRSAEEMMGKKVDILIPAISRVESLRQINRSALKGEQREVVEIPIQHIDGSIRSVLWNSATIFSADDKTPLATIAQGQDITERKKAEETNARLNRSLKQQTRELTAANKELENYSLTISNNLKAPLRHLDGFSQALLEDYADRLNEQGKGYLNFISEASKLISRYMDGMLELSTITLSEINYTEVNLSQIVQKIAAGFKESNKLRKVKFVVQPGIVVSGDYSLLIKVIENLLENALKFTQNIPQARIEFGISRVKKKEAFFVKDNGVGFDMASASSLFTPFVRLHQAETYPGSGIGLAIVQRIIHRHGGEVWAESKIGEGATFFFTLDQPGNPPATVTALPGSQGG